MDIPTYDTGRQVTAIHVLTSERLIAVIDLTPDDLVIWGMYSIVSAYAKIMPGQHGGDGSNDKEIEKEKENWVIGDDVAQLNFTVEENRWGYSVKVVE